MVVILSYVWLPYLLQGRRKGRILRFALSTRTLWTPRLSVDLPSSLGEPGSVAWKFEKKGVIIVPGGEEDEILEAALEAGAEDVITEDSGFEIRTLPSDLGSVRSALAEAGIGFDSAEVTMIPQSTTPVDKATAPKVLRLVESLEDLDDVQNVYADFDIPDDVLASLS